MMLPFFVGIITLAACLAPKKTPYTFTSITLLKSSLLVFRTCKPEVSPHSMLAHFRLGQALIPFCNDPIRSVTILSSLDPTGPHDFKTCCYYGDPTSHISSTSPPAPGRCGTMSPFAARPTSLGPIGLQPSPSGPLTPGSHITFSVASILNGETPHAYAASKHVVIGLMRNLCVELGQYGIRVNCVSPYGVASPMLAGVLGLDEKTVEGIVYDSTNLKRTVMKAEDVAKAVVYLGSDEARYVSGLNLVVDGPPLLLSKWL